MTGKCRVFQGENVRSTRAPVTRARDACEGDDISDSCHDRARGSRDHSALTRRQPESRVDRREQGLRASTGSKVEGKYGPSGLLRDEIAHGAKADVFASANM